MSYTQCTEAELLDAIMQATEERGEEGLTVPEIAHLTGLGVDAVRKRLSVLKSRGEIEVVKVLRVTLADSQQRFPGYRITRNHHPDPESD